MLRVVIFFLVWVALWLPIAIPLAVWLKWYPWQPITLAQKLPLLASLYLLAPIVLWGATQVENTSFAAYGLPFQSAIVTSFGIGLSVGAGGLVVLFVLQWMLGWIVWHSASTHPLDQPLTVNNLLSTLLLTLFLGTWVSVTEELVFRGFLLNQLQQSYSTWGAAAIASVIFALLHLVWEGKGGIPQLPGLWLMGMVLALARWADGGNLGLAFGLHAGWVWAIASFDTTQLFTYTGKGNQWLTGFGEKPLAGILGILFLLVTAAVVWQLAPSPLTINALQNQ